VTPSYTLVNGTNGGLASNYVITSPSTLSASITPANLQLTGTRAYDGTTLVTGASLSAKGVGTQSFSVTGSGYDIASPYPQTNSLLTSLNGLSLGTGLNGALSTNYNALTLAGSTYSITPKALTVSGTSVATKTYDGTTVATLSNGTLVGVVAGDVVTLSQSGLFATASAGVSKAVTATDSISGASSSYYTLTQPTGLTASITAKALTVLGTTVSTKTYDGTAVATLTGGSLNGIISGDTVTLTQAGSFSTVNAGTSVAVTASDTLGGASAANYSITQPTGLTGIILPKSLTVTGTTVSTKSYDGTTTASLVGGTLSGVVGSESITLNQSGTFANANAGSSILVTATDSISGSTAANYLLVQPSGLTGNINPKQISISGAVANNKIYDGFSSATMSNWGTVSTGVATETLTLNHGSAVFSDANAGTSKVVTASGYSIADGSNGGLARNYVLASTTTTTSADINKAVLTVTANNDAKFITQTDTAGYAGVSFSGFVNGETSSVVTGSAVITRSNSGVDTAGVYSGVLAPNVSGLTASNYSFSPQTGSFTVVPANQLLVRVSSSPTTYGSTSDFSLVSAQYLYTNNGSNTVMNLTNITKVDSNHFTVSDGVGGVASFGIAASGATFSGSSNVNVGAYQVAPQGTVTTSGQNFSNVITMVGTQTVVAKTISLAGVSGVTKTYDGTTDLVGFTVGLNNVFTNDRVTATGTGQYATKDAGTGLSYTINNLSLAGLDSQNYQFSSGSYTGTDGQISKAHLTVSANPASKIYGEANPTFAATVSGFVNGETFSSSGVTGSPSLSSVASSTTSVGTATISVGSGSLSATNYDFSQTVDSTLTINPRPLNVVANAATKIYGDANPLFSFTAETSSTGRGLINGDTLSGLLNTTATTNSAVSSYPITSNLTNSNYDISYTGANLVVSPKPITITNSAVTRTYDASTTYGAVASSLSYTTNTALVGSDTIGSLTQSFSDTNGPISTGQIIKAGTFSSTPTAVVLSSGSLNNYSFSYNSTTNSVAKANLSISAVPSLTGNAYNGQVYTGTYTTTALGSDASSISVSGLASGTNAGTYTSSLTASGSVLTNYNTPTFSNANLVIDKRAIGFNANTFSKIYGNADPALTVSITSGSLASSDLLSDVTGTVTRATGENIGIYNVALGSGVKASNYNISFASNNQAMTISPRPITLAAKALSKFYGDADPSLAAVITVGSLGSVTVSDTLADVTGTLSRASGENVGSYNVALGSGAKASNYTISFASNNQALTISPRPITLTATALSKIYGDADPTLAAGITSGSLGSVTVSDTLTDVTGTLSRAVGENVGSYNVALGSGVKASNYTISFASNNQALTISPRPITLAATALSKIYGDADPTLAVGITSGSLGSVTVSDTLADVTGTLSRGAGENVGSYNVALGSGVKALNYTISFDSNNQAITVEPKSLKLLGQMDFSGQALLDTSKRTTTLTATNLVSNDTVNLTGFATLNASSPGQQEITGFSGLSLNNQNYTLARATGSVKVVATQPNIDGVLNSNVVKTTIALQTSQQTSSVSTPQKAETPPPTSETVTRGSAISISVERPAATNQSGLITVALSSEVAAPGKSFTFTLDANAVSNAPTFNEVRVMQMDGKPLPDWIRYEPETRTFTANAVPPGAFPLQIRLLAGNAESVVVIQEQPQVTNK